MYMYDTDIIITLSVLYRVAIMTTPTFTQKHM